MDKCTCCTCGFEWVKGKDGSHSCSQYLLKKIKLLESQVDELSKSPWVSVEESMPDEGAWYLIATTHPDFNERISTIAFLDSCDDEVIWLSHNDKEDDCSEWENVTHWMPLPEAPEEVL